MDKSETIEGSIKIGLIKGYEQNLLLLHSNNDFIDQVREYLLTVNVTQQLLLAKEQNSYNVKIHLEYPVVNFYNNAFPPHIWTDDLFNLIVWRLKHPSLTSKLHQKKLTLQ
jgi:hypothetical protein